MACTQIDHRLAAVAAVAVVHAPKQTYAHVQAKKGNTGSKRSGLLN